MDFPCGQLQQDGTSPAKGGDLVAELMNRQLVDSVPLPTDATNQCECGGVACTGPLSLGCELDLGIDSELDHLQVSYVPVPLVAEEEDDESPQDVAKRALHDLEAATLHYSAELADFRRLLGLAAAALEKYRGPGTFGPNQASKVYDSILAKLGRVAPDDDGTQRLYSLS